MALNVSAIHYFADIVDIYKIHSAHQLLIVDACRANHIYDLLGKVTIRAIAYYRKFLLALFGERVAEICHYDLASIAYNAECQVDEISDNVIADYSR